MPGAVGTNGIDSIGEVATVRIVGYFTHSRALKVTTANFVSYFTGQNLKSTMTHLTTAKNGRAVATQENVEEPTRSDYAKENDPSVSGSSQRPTTRQSHGSGGMGFRSSKGGIKSPRTCSLRGGCYMTFKTVTCVVPTQSAAADLDSFYIDLINSVGSQLYIGLNFSLGGYSFLFQIPSIGPGSLMLLSICSIQRICGFQLRPRRRHINKGKRSFSNIP